MSNIFQTMNHLFETSRMSNWPLSARVSKGVEELGEVATAALIIEGHIDHKTLDEPIEGEAADVIICVFDALCAAYPDKSFESILGLLGDSLDKKKDKWRKIVADRQLAARQ